MLKNRVILNIFNKFICFLQQYALLLHPVSDILAQKRIKKL